MEKDEQEVQDELDKAVEFVARGTRNYPGMSYEEGVRDALSWALGETEEAPFSELESPFDS